MRVFITGASSGIGEALAHEYAKRHKNSNTILGLVARRSEHLQKLQHQLETSYNIKCVVYALDVRDSAALSSAAADFIQRHGVPNVVIANAGVSSGTLTEQAEDMKAFQAVMGINVLGIVNTFQPFISAMRQATQNGDKAQLVGIASVAGVRGLPGAGAYSASKAAAIAYLESLAGRNATPQYCCDHYRPGYIRTPMTDINSYKMPFLMDADIAAAKFVNAIERKRRFIVIPWQMGWVAKLMRFIPPVLWDLLAKNAPHKKRIQVE